MTISVVTVESGYWSGANRGSLLRGKESRMSLKRSLFRLVALLGLLPALVLMIAALADGAGRRSVYSVVEVQSRLAHDPKAWVGRTVLVRGLIERCVASRSVRARQPCDKWPAVLVDPGSFGVSAPLPLMWGSLDPLLAFLRELPLVSWLVVPPQAPHWWTLATYRVQLRAAPQDLCSAGACYEALLLDAAL